jgi:DsbC/DsbD-like thiol-disulfide interchange protein
LRIVSGRRMHMLPLNRYHPKSWIVVAVELATLSLVTATLAGAETMPRGEPPHVAIAVFADHESVGPGETFWVAVAQQIEPGWHTYWVNPGDAGQATTLTWTLPPGYQVGEVQWPVPGVLRMGRDVTYGYEGKVVVLQQVRAPAAPAIATVSLAVEIRWLVCKEACIAEHARSEVAVRQIAAQPGLAAPRSEALFNAARDRLPQPAPWSASLLVHPSSLDLTLHGAARSVPPGSPVRFLPLAWGSVDNAAVQRPEWLGDDLVLTMTRGDLRDAPLSVIDGILVVGPASARRPGRGYVVHALTGDTAAVR